MFLHPGLNIGEQICFSSTDEIKRLSTLPYCACPVLCIDYIRTDFLREASRRKCDPLKRTTPPPIPTTQPAFVVASGPHTRDPSPALEGSHAPQPSHVRFESSCRSVLLPSVDRATLDVTRPSQKSVLIFEEYCRPAAPHSPFSGGLLVAIATREERVYLHAPRRRPGPS